jgi:hypothetical protein
MFNRLHPTKRQKVKSEDIARFSPIYGVFKRKRKTKSLALTDPIIVFPGGWDDTLPDWLKNATILERLTRLGLAPS